MTSVVSKLMTLKQNWKMVAVNPETDKKDETSESDSDEHYKEFIDTEHDDDSYNEDPAKDITVSNVCGE
jgi:hypothetical protein